MRTVQRMGQHRAPLRRTAAEIVADATWSVRYAAAGLPRAAKLAALSVGAALVAGAVVWVAVVGAPGANPFVRPPEKISPAAPPQAPVAVLDPLADVGLRTGVESKDGPKCEKAARRLAQVAADRTSKDVSVKVRQDVALQAQIVGTFCTAKRAAQINDQVLAPFFAPS